MNKIAFAVLLTGVTAVSQVGAQTITRANNVPPGQRPPAGMCRVWIDGVAPGRQPRPTTCAAARASAPANSIVVYGDDTPFPGQARGRFRDGTCNFERTSSNLGDIVFGHRTGRDADGNCDVRGAKELGVWYPTGRDANGYQMFSRRVRTADGRIVVERAQRNSAGQLVLVSSRNRASLGGLKNSDDNRTDRTLSKAERDRQHQLRKAEKDRQKAARRAARSENRVDRDDDDDDDRGRRNNNSNRNNNRGNGNGNGKRNN